MGDTSSNPKVYSETCKICGRKFSSLYKTQVKYNYGEHLKSHERKGEGEK